MYPSPKKKKKKPTDVPRYCCRHLWGEPARIVAGGGDPENNKNKPGLGPDDLVVDPPDRRTLFEECDWKSWMSMGQGTKVGDVESRSRNHRYYKKSTCNADRMAALYIDARRLKDDVPADETGELITKNTPMYVVYVYDS